MNYLAFDIETTPDADGLRVVHNMPATLPDNEVVEMAQRLRRQEKGHDFMPLPLHRVVAIGCLLRRAKESGEPFRVFCLPTDNPIDESGAIQAFFRLIDDYRPTLISWNGGGFDLPVLHYRAMKHGLTAPTYWNTEGQDYRWNNYVNRYHERHTDLMDLLAQYQPRAWASLDEFAKLCGLPGKIGIGGAGVWDAWKAGKHGEIYRYCQADAALTYLLYARFQHFRGKWGRDGESAALRRFLEAQGGQWEEFLRAWGESGSRSEGLF